MLSTVLVSLTLCVLVFFPLCLFWTYIHFSRKKIGTIQLKCSFIKIYFKMWKLSMHSNYDYFVYSINFQKMQSLLLCGSRFLKKEIDFSSLRSRYNRLANRKKLILLLEKNFKILKDMIIGTESFKIFQSGLNNGVKLWAFDECPGAFPDKVTSDIDFTDEVVVQCDVPDIKMLS